jgi:hypothetical protein
MRLKEGGIGMHLYDVRFNGSPWPPGGWTFTGGATPTVPTGNLIRARRGHAESTLFLEGEHSGAQCTVTVTVDDPSLIPRLLHFFKQHVGHPSLNSVRSKSLEGGAIMKRTALIAVSLGVLPVLAQAECGWLLMPPDSRCLQDRASGPATAFGRARSRPRAAGRSRRGA